SRGGVVAPVFGCAAGRAGRPVAVPGLVQVGVDACLPVRVHVAQDRQRAATIHGQRAAGRAERQDRRRLPLVADDRGGGSPDADRGGATKDLDERQRQAVIRRVRELISVELGVRGDDLQRISARKGVVPLVPRQEVVGGDAGRAVCMSAGRNEIGRAHV